MNRHVMAALSATSGNSRSRAAQVDVDVSRRKDGGKTTLTALVSESQSGAKSDRETTAGKWGGTAQHDRDIDPEYFAFAGLGRTVSRYREEKTIGGETDSRFASNSLLIGNEYTAQFTPTVSFKQR